MENRTLFRYIAGAGAAYFVFQLGILAVFGYTPTNDGDGFIELAEYCIGNGSIYPPKVIPAYPPFIWNIGQINLVILSLWLTGSIVPLLVLMCLLKALSAGLTAIIANRLFGSNVAMASMIVFILYPNSWGQCTTILSEAPSVFLILCGVWLSLCFKRLRIFAIAGVVFALSNWFRPVASIFIGITAVWLIAVLRRAALKPVMAMAGGFAAFTLFLASSTWLLTGHFVAQANTNWYNIVAQCYEGAPVETIYTVEAWDKNTPRYVEGHENMTVYELADIWKERSIDYLSDHKLELLKKIPVRLVFMYRADNTWNCAFLEDKSHTEDNYITLPYRHILTEFSTLSGAQKLSCFGYIAYILLLVLFVIGAFKAAKGGRAYSWNAVLPMAYIALGSLACVTLVQGEERYKEPFMPFIIIIAAVAVAALYQRIWKRE